MGALDSVDIRQQPIQVEIVSAQQAKRISQMEGRRVIVIQQPAPSVQPQPQIIYIEKDDKSLFKGLLWGGAATATGVATGISATVTGIALIVPPLAIFPAITTIILGVSTINFVGNSLRNIF